LQKQPDFHFKISGLLAALKLTDKSGYPDNGYRDMQTLALLQLIEIRVRKSSIIQFLLTNLFVADRVALPLAGTDVNKLRKRLGLAMSGGPKFLENSGKYKTEKDGFDDGSGAGRR